jgi:hypothetical protein
MVDMPHPISKGSFHFCPVCIRVAASDETAVFSCCFVKRVRSRQLGSTSGDTHYFGIEIATVFDASGVATPIQPMATDFIRRKEWTI